MSNGVSTVLEMWKPITVRNHPEDGDHTVSETSILTSAAWYKVQEGIFD
jgi:hypothetical protein